MIIQKEHQNYNDAVEDSIKERGNVAIREGYFSWESKPQGSNAKNRFADRVELKPFKKLIENVKKGGKNNKKFNYEDVGVVYQVGKVEEDSDGLIEAVLREKNAIEDIYGIFKNRTKVDGKFKTVFLPYNEPGKRTAHIYSNPKSYVVVDDFPLYTNLFTTTSSISMYSFLNTLI